MTTPLKELITFFKCNIKHSSRVLCTVAKTKQPNNASKCNPPKKRGLVLGAYAGVTLRLTAAAEEFNKKCDCKLEKQLQIAAGRKMKEGKSFIFYNMGDFHTIVVVVLPTQFRNEDIENINQAREAIRVAAGVGCRALKSAGLCDIIVDSFSDAEAAAEGSYLSSYKFQEYKKKKEPKTCINVMESHESDCGKWYDGYVKANAQNIARKLQDTPSNFMTPTIFAENAKKLLTKANVTVNIYDKSWAEKQNMHSFLSVARGSEEEPKFLEVLYGNTSKNPFVLVGKGITFDSGGIGVKPSNNMADMKGDMGGAATIIGALWALGTLDINANIVALIPLAENMPSGKATKPGDVFIAANGKSICVDNTDAEGRLVLADALSYSAKFKPKWVVNIATLTGAMMVSLGNSASGVFSNSNRLYKILEGAGALAGDRVWRFPLWNHFTKQVTAFPHVDVNNLAKAKGGGSCTAAAFLREFVPPGTEWMHIDMCSVMGPGDAASYLSGSSMPGRPTRTLIEFLMAEAKGKNIST